MVAEMKKGNLYFHSVILCDHLKFLFLLNISKEKLCSIIFLFGNFTFQSYMKYFSEFEYYHEN